MNKDPLPMADVGFDIAVKLLDC